MIVGDIIQLYVKTFPSVVEFFNSKNITMLQVVMQHAIDTEIVSIPRYTDYFSIYCMFLCHWKIAVSSTNVHIVITQFIYFSNITGRVSRWKWDANFSAQ